MAVADPDVTGTLAAYRRRIRELIERMDLASSIAELKVLRVEFDEAVAEVKRLREQLNPNLPFPERD